MGRRTVLHEPSVINHQNSIEELRLADVMGHAKQRHALPSLACTNKQSGSVVAVHAAKRLIQQRQPHIALREGAAKAYALPLAARYQRATLTKPGLQTIRQVAQNTPQSRCINRIADWARPRSSQL